MPRQIPRIVPERKNPDELIRMWWLSLGFATVVVAAVAGLLGAIIATARSIDAHANSIWTVGKQIAGNTVSIWMLGKTNDQVARILDAAQAIDRTAVSIDQKVQALTRADGRGG